MIETWIEIIVDIFIILLLLFGTFFIFSSTIGVLRFPDVYTRLHASTKAATLGIAGIMIGAFLFLFAEHGIVSGKLLLGIMFVLLTAPVSAHMIGRAAHHTGIKPWSSNDKQQDAYADAIKEQKNK
ncbi:monovalent cation/H(+) antiporter subunit G [Saliterribacillus persicus]|uniref:Multisubunit sodium/proton antiporter MrpG subunit n=1 Tax=Saliterribacillus persicus TaxID=930114 RepID=A0A368XFL7_9BACI|nr:monovalent cation/H(+) antiporter subunit G [Saliterribacillus persicus]RCW65287.1 multisubunit sodium/proton antiporter MrpG subunit [Saliterribacillus persicus]